MKKFPLYAALGLVLTGGSIGGAVALTGGDDDKAASKAAAGKDAALRYPSTWTNLDGKALAKSEGNKPLAAIQRKDRSGIVVVRAEAKRDASYQALARDLNSELKGRFKDYKPVTQRVIKTQAGEALYFSYIRRRQGTAQSITLAEVGGRTYSINTVVRGGAKKAATEAGAIIRSFGPATR